MSAVNEAKGDDGDADGESDGQRTQIKTREFSRKKIDKVFQSSADGS